MFHRKSVKALSPSLSGIPYFVQNYIETADSIVTVFDISDGAVVRKEPPQQWHLTEL